MNIHFETAWVLVVFLVSVRLGMVFLLTPIFAAAQVPVQVRILFVFALSAVVVGGMGIAPAHLNLVSGDLFLAVISEAVIGGLFAFGILAAFGAFLLAGRILDVQMGFGVASLVDPATRNPGSVLGIFLNLLALMLFFAVDGHHWLIRGLFYSFQQIPPGSLFTQIKLSALIAQFGIMFVYGMVIISPALFAILLIDIGLAMMARTMPQVNIFIVSLPIKIFTGLAMLAISLNYLGPVIGKVHQSIFTYWQELLN